MRHLTHLAAILVATLIGTAALAADDGSTALARQLTTAGAALFEARNAAGLANTFLDEAEIVMVSQGDAGTKRDVRRGHSAIEGLYTDLFRDGKSIRARNLVEHARFLGPDLLLISGTFELTSGTESPLTLPFVQIRQRSGADWKVQHLEVFLVPRG